MSPHTWRIDAQPLVDEAAGGNIRRAAAVLGVHERQLHRWLAGGVDVELADALCVQRLGLHPAIVWGPRWVAALRSLPRPDNVIGQLEQAIGRAAA